MIKLNDVNLEVTIRFKFRDVFRSKWLRKALAEGHSLEELFEETDECEELKEALHYWDTMKIEHVEIGEGDI